MRIHTVWATRKGFEQDAPELLVAWDEYTVENNPEGFTEAVQTEIESWQGEVAETREIWIDVPETALREAFAVPSLQGSVENIVDTR